MGTLAKQLGGQTQAKVFKKGGAVKHDDEAQDKKLIKKMMVQEDKKEMRCGGKAKKGR